jgi:periplasmic protein CpxP/Spy
MFSKSCRILTVAAMTLILGIGQAYAQENVSDSGTAAVATQLNMKQLHDQLNLNADQEVQWQSVLDAMRESHSAARMNADQMQAQEQALLQQPILDLAALHAAHEQVVQADAPLPGQSAKAWLTFYRALNDQQKTTVSNALRPHFEDISHHPARPYEPRTGL